MAEGGQSKSAIALFRSSPVMWVSLALLVEYLLLSLLYDVRQLRQQEGAARLIGWIGGAMPVVIAVITSTILIAGRQLRGVLLAEAPSSDAAAPRSRISWAWLAAHVIAYVALLGLSHRLFTTPEGSPIAAAHVALWLTSALATLVTGVPLAVPPRSLRRLLPTLGLLGVAAALGVLAYSGGFAATQFWEPLREVTLGVVWQLGSWIYPDLVVFPDDAIIGTPEFFVHVAPICSGFEGMGLMAVMLPSFIWFNRKHLRIPRVLLVIPLSIFGVWLANCLRITALLVLGLEVSGEVALGAFHSKAGWVFFSAIAIAVAYWVDRSPLWSHTAADREGTYDNPVAPYLLPLLTLVAISMVTGAFTLGVDWLYGVGIAGALLVLWYYRRRIAELWRDIDRSRALMAGGAALVAWWALTELPSLPRWFFVGGGDDPAALEAFEAELASSQFMLPWIAVRALGSSLVVPLIEELAFRGYLLRRFMSRDFDQVPYSQMSAVALLGSSLAFGLLHQAWLAATVVGLIFAWVQYKTGSIANAVLAHVIANIGVSAYVLISGDYGQWF